MPPIGRAAIAPPQSPAAAAAGGGGVPAAIIGAGVGAAAGAFGRAPAAPIGGAPSASPFASAAPSPELAASSLCGLHEILADLGQDRAVGRVDGSDGVLGYFAWSAGQAALLPVSRIDFWVDPTGACWDTNGVQDYQWTPLYGYAPGWSGAGLRLDVTDSDPVCAVYVPSLARVSLRYALAAAYIASITPETPAHGTSPPVIYAGLWRIISPPTSGLLAGAAVGIASASAWGRALLTGSLAAPTIAAGPSGALPPANVPFTETGAAVWGGAWSDNDALLSGGWQPQAASLARLSADVTVGSAGDLLALVLGATRGDGATPLDAVTFDSLSVFAGSLS